MNVLCVFTPTMHKLEPGEKIQWSHVYVKSFSCEELSKQNFSIKPRTVPPQDTHIHKEFHILPTYKI